MKRTLTLIAAMLTLTAAVAQKSSLTATVSGLTGGMKVVLCVPQGGRLVPADTLTPDNKGRIKLDREGSTPQFFALTLNQAQSPMVHVILLPKEKVSMDVEYQPELNFLKVSNVKGSQNMALYADYSQLMSDAIRIPERQATLADGMEQLIAAHPNQLMSAFLVTYFETAFEQYAPLYKQVRDALIGTYPNNEFVLHLDEKVRGAVLVGMEAPDIVMADRDGKTRRLSDLRGKVVLIDFWASWCRPCRAENPNVVRLYKQYRDKGFDIFSVSLDNSREAWLRTIAADGLVWENHVSDLRGWSSSGGRLYGVNSIPATVLVGPDGKVLARNLRGPELEKKLKEVLGQ